MSVVCAARQCCTISNTAEITLVGRSINASFDRTVFPCQGFYRARLRLYAVHVVFGEHTIARNDCEAFALRLSDQQSVEWIGMMQR